MCLILTCKDSEIGTIRLIDSDNHYTGGAFNEESSTIPMSSRVMVCHHWEHY